MTKHQTVAAVEGALPMQMRLLGEASSFVEETREMDVIASTGATVRRMRYRGWDEAVPYDEELVVSESAINMQRMNDGAPVLDSHSTWGGIRNQLGVVLRAWVEKGQMMARVRLHAEGVSEAADALAGMIRGGTAPKLSLGYILEKVNVIEPQKRGDVERWVVERWQPFELSFVSVPADAGTGVRAAAAGDYPVTFNRALTPNTEEKTMADMDNASTGKEPVETRNADIAAAQRAAVEADRRRAGEIRSLGTAHKLPDTMVNAAIDGGTRIEDFRALALDHLATAQERQPIVTASSSPSGDDPAVRSAAMAEALFARILRRDPSSDHARSYMDFGFADMAAEMQGLSSRRLTAKTRDDVLHRAFHTTSDFPGLLENVANKVMLDRYQAATPTYRMIGRNRNFTDFKTHNMLRAGDFPPLLAVGETGEIKAGTVSESKETIRLATYARQVRFSRNMLINDDMNAMGDVIGSIGTRVADFENATFWAMVAANPTLLTDSTAVFHADHNNYTASGTAISADSIGVGTALMMKQTSLDGIKLNIIPKYIVTSPDRRLKAQQITTPIVARAAADVNPQGPTLTPIADANLTGNAWYLIADPATAECFVYGYLDGAAGPQTRIDEPFGVLGVALQVVLDFAVGANDFRGGYLNAGA